MPTAAPASVTSGRTGRTASPAPRPRRPPPATASAGRAPRNRSDRRPSDRGRWPPRCDERQPGSPGRPLVRRGRLGERLVRRVGGGVDGSGALGQRQDVRRRGRARANVAPPSVDRNSAGAARHGPGHQQRPRAQVRVNATSAPLSKESGTATVAPPPVASASASPSAPMGAATPGRRRSDRSPRSAPARAPSAVVRSASCQVAPPSVDRASVGAAAAPCGEREIDCHRIRRGDLHTGDEVAGRRRCRASDRTSRRRPSIRRPCRRRPLRRRRGRRPAPACRRSDRRTRPRRARPPSAPPAACQPQASSSEKTSLPFATAYSRCAGAGPI